MTPESNSRCASWQQRLDDYVDGRLPATAQAELETHLEGCESCRREVAEIEELLTAARDLPRSLEPPWNSWPQVEARLTLRTHRPWVRGWIPQAIAAALLVAFGGFASQWLWPEDRGPRVAESTSAEEAVNAGMVALARAEADYLRVKESLWITVYHHRDELSPMTVNVVEHNLRTIDKAIEEIHQALEQDPGNPRLTSQLLANHRRGIGLLRRLATASMET